MVILGVDYGRKRIGLAVGDVNSGFVFPLRSIVREKGTDPHAEVLAAAKSENATHIVVGVPRRLDGKTDVPGEMEAEALAFVDDLRKRTDLTVDIEDERFSTALAERLCQGAEKVAKTADKDAIAACVILESFIMRTFGRNEDVGWLKE
jgi:putative Holliday junction resolvase